MGDFTAITTQEELDKIITGRLEKQKESFSKKYEGFISPDDVSKIKSEYDKQIADLQNAVKVAGDKAAKSDKDIAERDAKIKGYEISALKSRIAHENGIPYELAARLNGDSEEDIKKDAVNLAKFISSGADEPPLRTTEPDGTDMTRTALKSMLSDLKGE